MGVLTWRLVPVAFAILTICCSQINSEEPNISQNEAATSKQMHKRTDSLDLKCKDACDRSGNILECQTKFKERCVGRYFLLCLRTGKGHCLWQTYESECLPPGNPKLYAKCNELVRLSNSQKNRFSRRYFDRTNLDGKRVRRDNIVKRRAQYRMDDGTDLGLSGRRGLAVATSGDDAFSYGMDGHVFRSADGRQGPQVSTSGNGHAFASEGNQLVESHYGGPPVMTTIPSSAPYPTQASSAHPSYFSRNYGQAFTQAYPGYGQNYHHHHPPNYAQSGWAGVSTNANPGSAFAQSTVSPLGSFFHRVGLEDPFLMLQRLPQAIFSRHFGDPVMAEASASSESAESAHSGPSSSEDHSDFAYASAESGSNEHEFVYIGALHL